VLQTRIKVVTLLGLAVIFLILALVAYLLGAKRIAGFSVDIAKVILAIFVALFVLVLLFGTALVL
jgi:uncharacterized membrane protein YtjA (UPF0391 family)